MYNGKARRDGGLRCMDIIFRWKGQCNCCFRLRQTGTLNAVSQMKEHGRFGFTSGPIGGNEWQAK
jgi:hypothetical protein